MNTGLIPARYAKALLEFAHETEIQEQIYNEFKTLRANYVNQPQLRSVLDNPVLSRSEKRNIVITAAGVKVCKSFERFLDMLLDNNRLPFLFEIALKYIDLYRKKNNIYFGKLTSATQVNNDTESKIIKLIETSTGGTLEIEKITDSEIIGGFLFEVDFVRWDASVSGQLRRIRNEYIEKNKKTV